MTRLKRLFSKESNSLRILPIIAGVLFVLCLPLLLITSNVSYAVNSQRLYEYSFNRYDVADVTGIDRSELDHVAREMIHYFNSGDSKIDIKINDEGDQYDLFTEQDVAHLKDVKHLIHTVYWVQIGTFMYALAFIGGTLALSKGRRWRWLLKWLLAGCAVTVFLMLIVGLLALFGFDRFFLEFHYLSFSNDLWRMQDWDMLPQMFPVSFFYDATKFIVMAIVAEVLLLGGISAAILYKTREKKTQTVNDR